MTIARIFSNETYERLKGAARDLIGAAGGPRRCQGITRGTESLLSRYGARQEEVFAPIDVIADLEKDAGEPIVTKLLAELSGHLLVPMPTATGDTNWKAHVVSLLSECGKVPIGLTQATLDDEVSRAEAKELLPQVTAAQVVLAALADSLTRVVEGEKR